MIINNIKFYRENASLTQKALAKKLDISRQSIISLEKHKFMPSLELAFKISYVLDVSLNELFYYKGE